jgi:hypothetical protein
VTYLRKLPLDLLALDIITANMSSWMEIYLNINRMSN